MIQGSGQFLPTPADKGRQLLQGDGDLIGHQGPGLGRGQPFHLDPAGQDQSLSLSPAFGQAPSHQQLVKPGLGWSVFSFQFSPSVTLDDRAVMVTQP